MDLGAPDQQPRSPDQEQQDLHRNVFESHAFAAARQCVRFSIQLEIRESEAAGHESGSYAGAGTRSSRKLQTTSMAPDSAGREDGCSEEDRMLRLRSVSVAAFGVSLLAAGCTATSTSPSAPESSSAGSALRDSAAPPQAAEPPFNLEAVLRGEGFGLVTFRQDKDPTGNIVTLDVRVRALEPNTSYSLQRAVDSTLDGACTGSNWLTLGQGATPVPVVTDATGSGTASLWRDLSAVQPGTAFDIYFRIVRTGTSDVALQSDCYRFVVRN
jgi:hypothetical protein